MAQRAGAHCLACPRPRVAAPSPPPRAPAQSAPQHASLTRANARRTSIRSNAVSSNSSNSGNSGNSINSGGSFAEAELRRLEEGMAERRAVDRSETLLENPYAPVETAMSSPVVTSTPDAPVATLLEALQHFTGVPVVDARGRCVGVVSSTDVIQRQRRASPSVASLTVKDVMTSPAVVIAAHAPIAYAAGLMLKHKIHRIPVVNSEDVVIGIVSRTDIYEPLLPQVNPLFHRLVGSPPDHLSDF